MQRSLNNFINNDPMALVLMSFLSGLLFSSSSNGIIFVLLFLIFWEFLYYGYLSVNSKRWDWQLRITILLAAVLGYLVGASTIHDNDDHLESCKKFPKEIKHYAKECDWI
jgi:hypothetical protein